MDEQTRLPRGRPWLSVAVDVPTRMVAGFHLSFDDPSALAVALVLTHAVLPKEAWLVERQISLPWPVSGIPDWIETDNGEEFHSKAFERGATEYGIRLMYRPRGAPQVGGHIERLIGTFMHRIDLIPGTTFSNVAAKGGYDSEARAVMTLKNSNAGLALEILGVYHKSVHSALHQPSSGAGLATTDYDQPGADPPPSRSRPFSFGIFRRGTVDPPGWYPDIQPALLGQCAEPARRPFPAAFRRQIRSARPVSGSLARRKGDYWTIPYRDLGAPPLMALT